MIQKEWILRRIPRYLWCSGVRPPSERPAPEPPLEHEVVARPPLANRSRLWGGDRRFYFGVLAVGRGVARRGDTAVARARQCGCECRCEPADSGTPAHSGAGSVAGLHRTAGNRPGHVRAGFAPRGPPCAPSSSRASSGCPLRPPRPDSSGAGRGCRAGSGNPGRGAPARQRSEGQGEGARPQA
jgi:hypothetical protein